MSRLMVIGGFLGAGKTTAMIEAANYLKSQGSSVGLITNDQTDFLVDTLYVENVGLNVTELVGSCFCCNYSGFSECLNEMKQEDFVLAEPVGSCTDLVSTIMKPSKEGKAGDLEVLPLSVLVEPRRLQNFMDKNTDAFSDGVYYIMEKQLEEADFIVLNKIDTLSEDEKNRFISYLEMHYPQSSVLGISAKEKNGLEEWIKAVLSADITASNNREMMVEYQTYGDAEAEMGWLNARVHIVADEDINGDDLIFDLGKRLKDAVVSEKGEIGHLKLFFETDKGVSKLSCVGVHQPIDVDKVIDQSIKTGQLTINLRASVDPAALKKHTDNSVLTLGEGLGFKADHFVIDAFRPGFPNPTYRM